MTDRYDRVDTARTFFTAQQWPRCERTRRSSRKKKQHHANKKYIFARKEKAIIEYASVYCAINRRRINKNAENESRAFSFRVSL